MLMLTEDNAAQPPVHARQGQGPDDQTKTVPDGEVHAGQRRRLERRGPKGGQQHEAGVERQIGGEQPQAETGVDGVHGASAGDKTWE